MADAVCGPGSAVCLAISISGAVQGVGFRPFVFHLASELGLTGYVTNTSQGILIEVEGGAHQVEDFWHSVQQELPPMSSIQSINASWLPPRGYEQFEIRHSSDTGEKTAVVLPDIATCPQCLAEVFDPSNRRYRYPFTNCTHCGPRFSIVEAIPYDRVNTTMRRFTMCPECQVEYDDPLDRRFHAQPNACPACGPHLELWDGLWRKLAEGDDALLRAAEAIRSGRIVALKGLGGFLLLADARNDETVALLRARKHREEKPFALLFPNVPMVREACAATPFEEALLCSAEAPIVLLRRKYHAYVVAASVAPGNPYLGVMLPYTPLHHLLLHELQFPIVATSGNLADEPICIDEDEAFERLRGIADLFLIHNRPIVRPIDDSVVRVMMGRELVLRRARGYAPLPIPLERVPTPILAVGAHLKSTVALAKGQDCYLSQHLGDLDTLAACSAFERAISSVEALYENRPQYVACDLHPHYWSTAFASRLGATAIPVQHHHAHVAACMAENRLDGPVLGVAWDGTGYGADGGAWGGEFLVATADDFERVAHLRGFRLPGGDAAAREPRRCAVGLLFALWQERAFEMEALAPLSAFTPQERSRLRVMLTREVNTPFTTSAGRLFDAMASLLNLRQTASYEGQAAMELESVISEVRSSRIYPMTLRDDVNRFILDWAPLVQGVVDDVGRGVSAGEIAAAFHNSLVEGIVTVAKRCGQKQVVLTGGCFQNRYLTERAVARLSSEGFTPYWHRYVPPNDGGIAFGQAVVAAARLRKQQESSPCV